jgi:hypothetical protein
VSLVAAALVAGGGCTEIGPDGGSAPGTGRRKAEAPDAGSRPPRARSCGRRVELATPDPDRPRYRIRMAVEPGRGRVKGHLRVAFSPDLETDRMIFRLWPNGPRQSDEGIELEVGAAVVDGEPAPSRRTNPTTLQVMLPRPLGAGDSVTTTLPWTLRLPGPVHDRISHDGNSVRLGSFFPLLAWSPGQGWLRDPPTRSLAETSASPVADFDVRVRVPTGLEVLATGQQIGDRWQAKSVRDFALAVGRFESVTGVAHAPERVEVTVGVDAALDEPAVTYRSDVIRALEALSALYGPYPWPTFKLALTPNLESTGIEYPTFVMQGADTSGLVTTHEVAHMWFYSLVGSNPAREPWLDEGLTTYAQARVDGRVEDFAAAEIPPPARNHLGEGMSFWDRHQEEYFYGVYLQGVKALAALGPLGVTDCALKEYVAARAFAIADSEDLVRALEERIPRAGRVLGRFGVDS